MISAKQIANLAAHFECEVKLKSKPGGEFPDWQQLAGLTAQVLLAQPERLPIIGISGSQGSGKSTFATYLAGALEQASVVSLDDFYLTRAERTNLSVNVHPLLAARGVPGTHDHVWLRRVLEGIRKGEEVSVPRFDKAEDDRSGETKIDTETLIFEGWCLGVEPEDERALVTPCNALEQTEDTDGRWRSWVNEQIREYYVELWSNIDFWIHLRVPGFDQVVEWRTQQEQVLAETKRMRAEEIDRFVQHYERLTRHLWRSPARGPGLVVHLDAAHEIQTIAPVSFR